MSEARLQSVKILFFGTSEFAIPSLEALLRKGYTIAGVVTNPDEPKGRKNILTPPPVKVVAKKHGVQVWQPQRLEVGGFRVEEIPNADLFIVCAYGKIIPKTILDIPKYGALNIHPSLLPRWRGPSPIQYTILNGDTETGVTIITMDEKVDHGDVVATSRFPLPASRNITYPELHDQLAKQGAQLLIEALPRWVKGEIKPTPQDHDKATYSQKLTRENGKIDWSKSAVEIERIVRAFTPWPGAWTVWKDKRIRIDRADMSQETPPPGDPGLMWKNSKNELLVKTKHDNLVIKILTPEGKKTMDAQSFLRGHPDFNALQQS